MCVILVSGLAALLLYDALRERDPHEVGTFRLTHADGGFALVYDTQRDDDCVAVFRERVVLAVERSLKETLGACRLDGHVDGDGAAVVLSTAAANGDREHREVVWQGRCV